MVAADTRASAADLTLLPVDIDAAQYIIDAYETGDGIIVIISAACAITDACFAGIKPVKK